MGRHLAESSAEQALDTPASGPGRRQKVAGRGRSLRRRVMLVVAIAGPGLIAANAGNDAGGIATYASAGSQYRYDTLFVMVLITIGLVVVQEMAARLGAITGKGLASLIREEFSIRMATLALGALLVANVGIVVSEFAGIAAAFELFGVSRYISIPIAAVVSWVRVLFGSYRYAERVFLILSLAFLVYPFTAGLAHPDWAAVGLHTVVPHLKTTKGFVLLVVALIGTTSSPYMQLYNASAVVDRGIGPAEYPIERIDTVSGAIFADLISWFIIVATAAAIGGSGVLASAKEAAIALRPVAGPGAEILFGLGLLGASALAGAVVPLSTSYAIAEAIGVERSVSRSFKQAPVFRGLFSAQVLIGAVIALVPVNLITLLIGTQVLQGVITPITLVYILILANRRSLLGEWANGPIFRAVATVAVTVVALMASILVVLTVLSWFGVS